MIKIKSKITIKMKSNPLGSGGAFCLIGRA